jgi:Fic family protein
MAEYVERQWEPSSTFGLTKKDQAGGTYRAFIPDALGVAGPELSTEVYCLVTEAQSAATRADATIGETGLFLNHLLVRSESISSSYIEGHIISPKRLAIADLLGQGKANALAVIGNVRATEYAIGELAVKGDVTPEDLITLQHAILPHLVPEFRTEQNWVGGRGYSPLSAEFVPPPPEFVNHLVDDLLTFVNRSRQPAVIKAAIAHAQFETIHPFVDGNGRTGRALIHAILKREGVTQNTILPISTVFSGGKDAYVAGLTQFRQIPADVNAWVTSFCEATILAAEKAIRLKNRSAEVDQALLARHQQWRESAGLPAQARAGSVVSRILENLAANPVLTVKTVGELFDVGLTAADSGLNELADAGILSRNKDHKGAISAFASDEHLNLVK